MSARLFVISLLAVSNVFARRIAAVDVDGNAKLATASTDPLVGVFDDVDGNAGTAVAVVSGGIAEVELGGTVAAGDFITAGTDGKGITGTGRVVGTALQSGVTGDIINVLVMPGKA